MALDIRSSYLSPIFNPDSLKITVDSLVRQTILLKEKYGFDTIVFSGTSGTSMGFLLSHLLDIPVLCIRKKNDSSHYSNWRGPLEGNIGLERYLIVDDFISSGDTVRYIMDEIHREVPKAKCVALLMYTQYDADGDRAYFRPRDSAEPIRVYASRPAGI
jgi:adenine/guanine phosphoribosyltransferase-like PRPP-binding protein